MNVNASNTSRRQGIVNSAIAAGLLAQLVFTGPATASNRARETSALPELRVTQPALDMKSLPLTPLIRATESGADIQPTDNPTHSLTFTHTFPVKLYLPVAGHDFDGRTRVQVRTLLDDERVLDGQTITATLLIEASAAAAVSGLTVTLQLTDGLEYVPGSAAHHTGTVTVDYVTATRQLVWRNVGAGARGQGVYPYRLRVNAAALPLPLNRTISLTVSGGAHAQRYETSTTLVRIGRAKPDSVQLTPEAWGRYSLVNGRVALTFPPGAVTQTTTITGVEYAPVAVTAGQLGQAVLFDLYPDITFSAPVTIQIDLNGLVITSGLTLGQWPVLRYLARETVTRAVQISPTLTTVLTSTLLREHEIASQFDAAPGWLQASLTHFSAYQAGVEYAEPKPWKFSTNLGDVSLFRGSAEFAQPLQLPPMQDNLQPPLALKYSSAGADQGAKDTNSLGLGWSLDAPKITRRVKQEVKLVESTHYVNLGFFGIGEDVAEACHDAYLEYDNGYCGYWEHEAHYEVNGYYANDFTLSLGGNDYSLVPDGSSGEYVTENYAPLRIRRCNDRMPCTPGRVDDAQVYTQASNATGEFWQVWTSDGTRYVFGSAPETEQLFRASYDPSRDDYAGRRSGQVAAAWFLRTVYARHRDDPIAGPWSVEYYYAKRAVDGTDVEVRLTNLTYGNSINVSGASVTPQYQVYFDYTGSGDDWQPSRIRVLARSQQLRHYALDYDGEKNLSAIREQVWNGYQYVSLPAVRFEYGKSDGKTLLTRVRNGYGGEQRYTYGGDGNGHYVTQRATSNGFGWSGAQRYAYTGACYNRDGQPCRTGHDWSPSGALIGFAQVTETVAGSAGVGTLSASAHRFFVDRQRLGREYETRALNAAQTATLALQTTEYAVLAADVGLPAGAWFAAPVTATSYPNSGSTYLTGTFKRAVSGYDRALQGGRFYGQATGAREYSGTQPVKVSLTAYTVNTRTWVLRPVSETLAGADGTRISEMRYYYDNLPGGVITGDLTFVQQIAQVDGVDRSRDIAIIYDRLGNKTSETVFDDYGAVGQTVGLPSRPGATSHFEYDPEFGFYPITWTNPLSQVTHVEYYGIENGAGRVEPLISSLTGTNYARLWSSFGLVKRHVEANGAATLYNYDVFGRLIGAAKPGDSLALPTVAYSYTDALNAGLGVTPPAASISGVAVATLQRPGGGVCRRGAV